MKRRSFLRQTALLSAAGFASLSAGGAHGWVWRNAAIANQPTAANPPRLIVIFLRGAADGLNIVVPYQEPNYYESRPTIAIAKPGAADGALDLDTQFGLHPALGALMPAWQSEQLAFVHASGLTVETRSHFQAQDYMETATPGVTATASGWLNRLLAVLPSGQPTQAVNIGSTLPLIFAGSKPVANLAIAGNSPRDLPTDRVQIQTAFDQLYAGDSPLAKVYQEGRAAREILQRELASETMAASRGAPAPNQFETSARYLARLMSGDAATQVAFMALGEWDTHVNERPALNRHLGFLGNGLATLAKELGAAYQNTTIVVMSEFGRTVAENGNGGTDHGHGNALWLMGGSLRGQKVYGEWPGLSAEALYESRDLAITTDFRDVLTSLLGQQFDLTAAQRSQIFPSYQAQKDFQLLQTR